MTAYLNDRIRELNKVKLELDQENRWIELSNQRIQELAQREKLVKMQDIISCLNQNAARLTGNQKVQTEALNRLKTNAAQVQSSINQIQGNIKAWTEGRPGAAGAPVAGAALAAAGGAPPAAAPPAAPAAPEQVPQAVAL